jgi:hypothetical protein
MATQRRLAAAAVVLVIALALTPLTESARRLNDDHDDDAGFKYMFKNAGEQLGERSAGGARRRHLERF